MIPIVWWIVSGVMLEAGQWESSAGGLSSYNDDVLAAMGIGEPSAPPKARVAIGFVDYGFDLLHPTLSSRCGSRSRFRFLWDQNHTPAAARAVRCDIAEVDDWDGAQLDDWVAAAQASGSRRRLDAMYDCHANNCGRHGTIGGAHGTLMASIAAGTPFAGFRGAAPEAELIGVQLALHDCDWKEQDLAGTPTWLQWRDTGQAEWSGWRSYDACHQVVHALEYLYHRGCWLGVDALVLNLSIGAWAGGHDGRSPVELAIAGLRERADRAFSAGRGPRTIVVVGAGNAGADEGHWRGIVDRRQPQSFDWIMQRRDPTQNKLEIWYDGAAAPLAVALGFPDGTSRSLAPGRTASLDTAGRRIGIADHRTGARGALSCLRVLIHPPYLPVGWFDGNGETAAFSVTMASEWASPLAVNAWIERDDGIVERSWLSPCHNEGALCCLATAGGALVVGGYDHRTMDDARLAVLPLSGCGPAPWPVDGGEPVPHFVVPAAGIRGARSKSRGFTTTTGTSAAAALASGAIARLLGERGRDAELPVPHGTWSPRFGYGPYRIDLSARTGVSP